MQQQFAVICKFKVLKKNVYMSEFIVQFVILVMFGCNSSCNVYRNRRMMVHIEELYKFYFCTPLLGIVDFIVFHVMFCSSIKNLIQSK